MIVVVVVVVVVVVIPPPVGEAGDIVPHSSVRPSI